MNSKVSKAFGIIYALIVVVLGAATLIEDQKGSGFVSQYIYGNWWFVILWALMVACGTYLAIKKRIWTDLPALLTHTSFAIILLGAFLSFTTGKSGYVHLIKEGQCKAYEDDKHQSHPLPFTMELDSFDVRYYPGTNAPMDYLSYMRVDGQAEIASMNRNFVKDGYRFCQSSFDDNGIGSWLSVSYDPWGVDTTFAGYILFVIAGIVTLVWPKGNFRALLRDPLLKKGGLFVALLAISLASSNLTAAEVQQKGKTKVPVISKNDAIKLQRKQVMYQNREVPFNTVAVDFVKKIYGSTNYHGLMPEQVVGGWMIAPEKWYYEKMIKVKSSELRQALGLTSKYCSMADLYDEKGNYRLQALWAQEQKTPEKSKLEKGISEVDEKIGIIQMLLHESLVKPLPKSVTPLSDTKVNAEILYNRLPLTKVMFMFNLTLGILAFSLLLYKGLSTKEEEPQWIKVVLRVLPFLLLAALLVHTFGYGLRWYISGRVPLNNGFETMQFLALAIMLTALVLCKRYRIALAFGFMMSGFTLLVSYLGEMNPQITPLMPVLNSPWLSTHVSLIMMSYALFAFILINSVFALIMTSRKGINEQVGQLTLINRILLYPATILIGIGILLGAVWANESWGCYWGWDPKEVWALITFMVYGAAIVFQGNKFFSNTKCFHWYMVLAFLTVLMTYFGVNYVLGGMHSYANG